MPTIRSILASSFSSFSTHQPEVDLEAQTIAPRPLNTPPSLPLLPPQVHATTIRVQPEVEAGTANAVDDFFEVSHPRRNGSRHDSNITAARCSAEGVFEEVAPPPYADASDLPSYTAVVEPPTLAMYLFKFGFRESYLCH